MHQTSSVLSSSVPLDRLFLVRGCGCGGWADGDPMASGPGRSRTDFAARQTGGRLLFSQKVQAQPYTQGRGVHACHPTHHTQLASGPQLACPLCHTFLPTQCTHCSFSTSTSRILHLIHLKFTGNSTLTHTPLYHAGSTAPNSSPPSTACSFPASTKRQCAVSRPIQRATEQDSSNRAGF
jgi:hypothetical protein